MKKEYIVIPATLQIHIQEVICMTLYILLLDYPVLNLQMDGDGQKKLSELTIKKERLIGVKTTQLNLM